LYNQKGRHSARSSGPFSGAKELLAGAGSALLRLDLCGSLAICRGFPHEFLLTLRIFLQIRLHSQQ
jgi:hypothetical protein